MKAYKQKLIVCENVMTDLFSLQNGWLAKKKELVWQNSHQFILRSLINLFAKSELKEGKAYRYYEWECV